MLTYAVPCRAPAGIVWPVHRLEPRGGGCVVAMDLRAAPPVEALMQGSYGPLVAPLLRNLVRRAERG